jgi:hypothetical protein
MRRLCRASARGVQAGAAAALTLVFAGLGTTRPAIAAALVSATLLMDGARHVHRAGRSGVGAESEACVRQALEPLRAEGWRIEHGLPWPGVGDIDHVVRAPDGAWFAIETKTRRYSHRQLKRTAATARWVGRRHRGGAAAVLCVVRERRRPAIEHDVLVISLGDLRAMLRALAEPSGGRRAGSHVRRRAFGGRAVARW